MPNDFLKETLPNGLTIILKEIHTAPLISHWVWYRVGSRNEVPGKTGISHWVEHMQFKGTPKYPSGVLDKAISRDGSVWNAFTYMDWTAFFATTPKDKISLPIELEADRMQNSLYVPEDVESERTVILSEREGSENEPLFQLGEAVDRAAFAHHPYGIEVIGESADLKRLTRDDLYAHYRQFYAPNNAVLTMAGDFDARQMLDKLAETYRDIPARPTPSQVIQPEGKLQQEQRVEIEGPGDTVYLKLVWRAPAGSQREMFVLSVLDSMLTGPSSLNMFGGGSISNRTSRLYQPLIEDQIAIAFGGDYNTTIDPYLYSIVAILHPEHQPDEILRVIDHELDRLRKGQIEQAELDKAVKQARALFAYGCENITNQAYWLGYPTMFAETEWFTRLVPSLQTVTIDEIVAFAREWLNEDQRVVGIYRPYGSERRNP